MESERERERVRVGKERKGEKKVVAPKSACTSLHFNYDHLVFAPKPSSLALQLLLYILPILIIFVISCNVCVFYFCIMSNKLNSLRQLVLVYNTTVLRLPLS